MISLPNNNSKNSNNNINNNINKTSSVCSSNSRSRVRFCQTVLVGTVPSRDEHISSNVWYSQSELIHFYIDFNNNDKSTKRWIRRKRIFNKLERRLTTKKSKSKSLSLSLSLSSSSSSSSLLTSSKLFRMSSKSKLISPNKPSAIDNNLIGRRRSIEQIQRQRQRIRNHSYHDNHQSRTFR